MAENALDTVINTAAARPKKAVVDGMTVEQHSIPDLIALDQHQSAKRAMANTGLGIKFTKLSAHGSV